MRTRTLKLQPVALSDNNGLETDIMRFFAIISLCLMVIFSLVQSIPMKGNDAEKQDKPPELLSVEILQNKVNKLQLNLMNLKTKNNQLNNELSTHRQQWNSEKKAINHIISQVQKKLNESKKKLKSSQQQLDKSQQQLDRIQQENRLLGKQLLVANQHFKKAQSSYQSALNKTKTVKQSIAVNITKKVPKPKKPKTQKPEKKQDEGFSLTFYDDQSLVDLIKAQRIQYYLISGKQVFQYQWQGAQWKLNAVSIQQQMYLMHEDTVPDLLAQVARQKLIAFSGSKVQFGVVLSKYAVEEINTYMKRYSGGRIVINQLGQTEIKNASH